METRRLKLFVVAYLRGLLRPDYKNGKSSQIRENLVLTALDRELDAELLKDSALVDLSLLQCVAPNSENLSGQYDNVYDKISNIRKLREFDQIT